jgi:hypothetical protein
MRSSNRPKPIAHNNLWTLWPKGGGISGVTQSGGLQKKQGGSQEAALLAACFEQRLNRSSTAEEVEQNGDNRQNQQNVNEAAGHVECREAQKPQNQENSGNDR